MSRNSRESAGKFLELFIESMVETFSSKNSQFHEPLIKRIIKAAGGNNHQAQRGLWNLQNRKIIYKINGGYRFTKTGQKWAAEKRLKYFKIKNKKWDGKWRIIIFDIPEELRKNRDSFRRKLYNLGFYMLQKSVFVLPYPCDEELGYICSCLDITDYVDVIRAESVGYKEKEIKKFFDV